MHLFNCLHPVSIRRNGDVVYVPCGKCDYCRYVRGLSHKERITNEMRSHKFCLFVTLTYHDSQLPLYHWNEYEHLCYKDCSTDLVSFHDNLDDGVCFPFIPKDAKETRLYCRIQSNYNGIPVLDRCDLQKFLKRVRIFIFRKICNKDKSLYEQFKITYAYCGEYGPSSYRPHYHLLLMFDNPEICSPLSQNLCTLWELGIVTQRWINTTEEDGHYISGYLNAVNRLPSFYNARLVAPFFGTSRSSPFGFPKISKEALRKTFLESSSTIVVEDPITEQKDIIPVPVYIENRLFPKVLGFNDITNYELARLLRLCRDCPSFEDWQIEFLHLPTSFAHYDFSKWLDVYCKQTKLSALEPDVDCERVRCSAARSIWYVKNKYVKLCSLFNVSLEDCIAIVRKYYYNKDMLRLSMQYEFQNTFMDMHPEWLDYFYSAGSTSYEIMLKTEFGRILMYIKEQIEHSHKNKRKREYLSCHPEYNYIVDYDRDLAASFINNLNF